MQKFPWVQFLTSLIFYVVIAVFLYVLATLLPTPAARTLTPDQSNQLQQEKQTQQTQAIYQQVLTAVGRHVVLPTTLPEISVVNDLPTFVAQNPGFVGTSVGDIVLAYTDRVIVYSPKTDRIVNTVMLPAQSTAAPISGASTPAPGTTSAAQPASSSDNTPAPTQ